MKQHYVMVFNLGLRFYMSVQMIMVLISFLCNFQVTIGTHGKLVKESKSMLVMVHFKHHKFDCIVRISSKLFSCGSIFSCFIFVALFSWLKFKLHASFEPVMYSRINISVLVLYCFPFFRNPFDSEVQKTQTN